MNRLLAGREKYKKDEYGKACYDQQRHFSSCFLYVYRMMGKEALVLLANLSQPMAAKINEAISHLIGWVNVWIKMAVARSYSRVIQRA